MLIVTVKGTALSRTYFRSVYQGPRRSSAHTGLQLIIRQQSHFSEIGNPPSNHLVWHYLTLTTTSCTPWTNHYNINNNTKTITRLS